ncbi:hypothetical protein C2845_PM05G11210 [Panicum miliaceum]|uniref:Uncharacterized protein n=1 Tax=Panicum miliaceum TaxID=4540 RepID=A0A3L6T3D4_PANMI|nr:hypothetical protein C2845_PM05G11210 [Panicum miliaceum]
MADVRYASVAWGPSARALRRCHAPTPLHSSAAAQRRRSPPPCSPPGAGRPSFWPSRDLEAAPSAASEIWSSVWPEEVEQWGGRRARGSEGYGGRGAPSPPPRGPTGPLLLAVALRRVRRPRPFGQRPASASAVPPWPSAACRCGWPGREPAAPWPAVAAVAVEAAGPPPPLGGPPPLTGMAATAGRRWGAGRPPSASRGARSAAVRARSARGKSGSAPGGRSRWRRWTPEEGRGGGRCRPWEGEKREWRGRGIKKGRG